jgi:hypothetical protein
VWHDLMPLLNVLCRPSRRYSLVRPAIGPGLSQNAKEDDPAITTHRPPEPRPLPPPGGSVLVAELYALCRWTWRPRQDTKWPVKRSRHMQGGCVFLCGLSLVLHSTNDTIYSGLAHLQPSGDGSDALAPSFNRRISLRSQSARGRPPTRP